MPEIEPNETVPVIVLDGFQEADHGDVATCLFEALSNDACLAGFSRFELAARKFQLSRQVLPPASLPNQDKAVIVEDNGDADVDWI